ncbi:MAG: tetratricopeptide repeat protein [Proteobacteria bacterium]|nr:tetratricopeptide repeat protein [Pseudomonadota bacterium]
MAKITKKVKMKKKEVKDDEIQDKIVDSLGIMKQYAKQIIIGSLIILIIIVMVNSYIKNNRKKELNANAQLSTAISLLNRGRIADAVGTIKDLEDQYWGTGASDKSVYYKALAEFEQRDFDKALKDARDALKTNKKNPYVTSYAYHLIGTIYEQKGDYKSAVKNYLPENYDKKLAKFTIPYAMYDAARCYEKEKRLKNAIDLLKQIEMEYKDFSIAKDAMAHRKFLEGLVTQL